MWPDSHHSGHSCSRPGSGHPQREARHQLRHAQRYRGVRPQVVEHVEPALSYIVFIRRIGRTGRMGNLGLATSFFNEKNRNLIRVGYQDIRGEKCLLSLWFIKDLIELLIESNQELPTWLESLGMDSRNMGGNRRAGKGRFGGTGFGAKDVRYENGGGGVKKTTSLGGRPSYGGGAGGQWSGPVGLTATSGGNYGAGPDWWDN